MLLNESMNVTQGMLLKECYSRNVTQRMLVKELMSVTQRMLLNECYSMKVTPIHCTHIISYVVYINVVCC